MINTCKQLEEVSNKTLQIPLKQIDRINFCSTFHEKHSIIDFNSTEYSHSLKMNCRFSHNNDDNAQIRQTKG